jgi:hypothetical protein
MFDFFQCFFLKNNYLFCCYKTVDILVSDGTQKELINAKRVFKIIVSLVRRKRMF